MKRRGEERKIEEGEGIKMKSKDRNKTIGR
jgi:hypothetical protein